jgi:hypothetical protein
VVVGGGRGVSAGVPSFSCVLRSGLSASGQDGAIGGGLYPIVLCHSRSQCVGMGHPRALCARRQHAAVPRRRASTRPDTVPASGSRGRADLVGDPQWADALNAFWSKRWAEAVEPALRLGVDYAAWAFCAVSARQCGSRDVTTTVHAARQPITATMSAAEAPTATLNGIRQIIGTRSAASANTPHPQVLTISLDAAPCAVAIRSRRTSTPVLSDVVERFDILVRALVR